MATIGTLLYTLTFGKKVGADEFGNKYYTTRFFSKQVGRYGKERRWVLFNGKAEASKIPSYWHGWMHYSFDDVPGEKDMKKTYKWQKQHLPNLTGTEFAYLPPGDAEKNAKRDKASSDYQSWKP